MKISIVQMNVVHGDKTANIQKLTTLLENTDEVGELILLPELFATGYVFEHAQEMLFLSEDLRRSVTVNALQSIAQKYKATIVAGIAEKFEESYFNSVVIVDNQGVKNIYRKISQTNIDRRYFSRGNELISFTLFGIRFGIVICFDIWFPEICRGYEKLNVNVLLHPANFGGEQSHKIAEARAIENSIYVATCNRLGVENVGEVNASYCGGSRVIDPTGCVVSSVDEQEVVLTLQIDSDLVKQKKIIGVDLAEELSTISSQLNQG